LPISASWVTEGGSSDSTSRSKSSSGTLATLRAVASCRFDMPARSAASRWVNLVSVPVLGWSVLAPGAWNCCSSSPHRLIALALMRTAVLSSVSSSAMRA
jgi:hypothetical protein